MLNISKMLVKSLLRVKMVMLAFLLQILYGDLNLSKNQKCGVCKSPSAHCCIRDDDLHYILCFLGDTGCLEEKIKCVCYLCLSLGLQTPIFGGA